VPPPLPSVAIVGRVNVGKSALFNRLTGGRTAIVDRMPGVTRDRNVGQCSWNGRDFFVIDTGGLSPGSDDPLQEAIGRQVDRAIAEADAIVLVVDGQAGVHPFDREAAELLRRSGIPCFLVVNKLDNHGMIGAAAEFWELGLGDPWPVSSLHGQGTGDLLDAIVAVLPEGEAGEAGDHVSLAVVGRPNVGKSSIVNRLCDSDRNIVTPEAGTTRDSTDTFVQWDGGEFRLVDTAGLRRRSRRMEDVEFYSTLRAWRSMSRGDVVLVVMDCSEAPAQQDLRIAGRAWEQGKGVIIGANKMDLGVDRDEWIRKLIDRFHPARWIPVLFFSALTGQGIGRILPTAATVSERRTAELKTSDLNRILGRAVDSVQPPTPGGKAVRLFYATQVAAAPPRILIFANRPGDIPENYRRYVENCFRSGLAMKGVPLRIVYRKREH
jgi:GTP-binding protein